MNKIVTKAAFIIVKSNRSTTQQAVAQDSNDRPNKLSRRTATRSQTRPVCNKGVTQFYLPPTHGPQFACTPQSQGNRPLTGTKLYCSVTRCLASNGGFSNRQTIKWRWIL